MATTHVETEYAVLRRVAIDEICRAFRVPRWVVMGGRNRPMHVAYSHRLRARRRRRRR